MAPRVLALAALPALGAAFLVPYVAVPRGRSLQMTRQGVQEKLERAFLRNAILNKDRYGYQIVKEQSEYDENYTVAGQDEEDVDGEAEVFSPLELTAMYGENYNGPFSEGDIEPGIGDFCLPSFSKGDIIKGIVVSAICRAIHARGMKTSMGNCWVKVQSSP